jgi:hypothetical protein
MLHEISEGMVVLNIDVYKEKNNLAQTTIAISVDNTSDFVNNEVVDNNSKNQLYLQQFDSE